MFRGTDSKIRKQESLREGPKLARATSIGMSHLAT